MKKLIFLSTILISICVFSQQKTETFYYDINWKTTDSASAVLMSIHIYSDTAQGAGLIIDQTKTGILKSETQYSNIDKAIKDGSEKVYHDNGILKLHANYSNDKLQGELKTYYENGQLKRKDIFENDEFISGNCYTKNGADTTHFPYSIEPHFPGGEYEMYKFISAKIQYPQMSLEMGNSGTVHVQFVVESDGSISNVTILRGVDEMIDREAMRVVKIMPDWVPGCVDGAVCRARFMIPITFKIN